MASNTGKWMVVTSKARKNSPKNKKKVNEADLPKLDIKPPIPESKTQFDAFNKKEPETFVVPKQESSDNDSDGRINARSEDRNRKMEKKHKHSKERHPDFDVVFAEALKKCDSASVKNAILECKHKYSDNALVLLKELTGFIQEAFAQMPVEKDSVLGNQTPDFPLGCVSNDVQDRIIDELKHCSEDDVDRFFSYCLDELLIEINKGHATYGVRMMIQCVLKCYPYVTIKNRKQYLERVKSRKDNPREALSLLWAFGQTSDHTNFEERLTVWTSYFLSVIDFKQLSKYVIGYLETTLRLERPEKFTETPVSAEEFQHILEITYGSNFSQFPYRKQMRSLYPKIKAIVFDARPANAPLTKVFAQLFDSLNTELGQEYVQEALNCLIECLKQDATCHYKWRNSYLSRLKESSLLLKAVTVHWDSICRSVPQKYLVETLQAFQNANNEELKEREKPRAGFLDCQASCKKLLDAISSTPVHIPTSRPSRIIRIFKIFLFVFFVVVCFDMYKHNGYQGSKTCEVLRQYGVEKAFVNAYNQSKVYAYQVASWTEKHYPYYYKKVRDVVEPASDYTMTKLGEGLYYLANVTAPARQYIHKNVPPLLEKFEHFVTYYFNLVSKVLLKLWNDYFPVVRRYSQRAWDTLVIWVPRVYFRAQELALNTAMWFYNLSPDFFDAIADGFRRLANEVVTKTPHILALVQEYLLTAWTLLVSYISDGVLWLKKNVI